MYIKTQNHLSSGVETDVFIWKYGLENALNYIELFVYKDIKQYVDDLHCFVYKSYDCY